MDREIASLQFSIFKDQSNTQLEELLGDEPVLLILLLETPPAPALEEEEGEFEFLLGFGLIPDKNDHITFIFTGTTLKN